MFIDYYSVLEISRDADKETIRKAYRKQALRWHPDKNPHRDTSREMQLINEAYLILSDPDAKARYDIEYAKFRRASSHDASDSSDAFRAFYTYDIRDEILKEWIVKAQAQSIELAKQTLSDISGMAKSSVVAAFDKVKYLLLVYLVIQIAWFLFS